MALGKKYSLTVGVNGEGVEITDLDIGFRVHRSNTPNNNTAEFDVYNVAPATVDRFFKKGAAVEFKLGWEDQDGGQLTTVFIGNVTEQSEELYLKADRKVSIQAQMIRNPATIDNTIIKISLPPDTPLSHLVTDVATALGYVVDGEIMLQGIKLPNGFTYMGRVKNVLDYLRSVLLASGLCFVTDLSDFIIYRENDPAGAKGTTNTEIAYLTWDTGLISVGRFEKYVQKLHFKSKNNSKIHDPSKDEILPPDHKIKLSCIINPLITANRVIRVETERIRGAFLVDDVEIYGDSTDGPFNMDIEAGNYNGTDFFYSGEEMQGDFNQSAGDTDVA